MKPSFQMVSWFPLTLNKLLHLFDVVGVPGGCGRGLLTGKLDEVTVGDIHVEGDAFLRARIGFRWEKNNRQGNYLSPQTGKLRRRIQNVNPLQCRIKSQIGVCKLPSYR